MTKDHNDPFYTISFEEESVIYKVGDESPCMYAILQGRVSLYKETASGEIQIKSIGPGNYLGAVSYLGEIPRRYKAVASQFTKLQQLFEDNIETYIKQNSQSVVVLLDDLSNRLAAADKSLGQIGGMTKCAEEDESCVETELDQIEVKVEEELVKHNIPDVNPLNHPIYPEGHKHYNMGLTPGHEEILFDKNVTCPVCDKDFTLYQMRISHLKLVEVRRDMRKIFDGVDEIWYNVWTCPHCKYSNFHYDFLRMRSINREKLLEEMPGRLVDFKLPETQKTSFNEVFDSYYLAMACKKIVGASAYEMGRLWLHIAWMYHDCGDEEMFDVAYENARANYAKGWFSERVQLSAEGEQKLAILISEMHLHFGHLEDARKFVFEAINIKKGTKALAELARDRLAEIKEQIQIKKKEERAVVQESVKEDE